jgi:SsrA-binding protein
MDKDVSKIKIIARNKKVEHFYDIVDKWEAGIVLTGPEVKGVRDGKVAFKDSYVEPVNSELYLVDFHITPLNSSFNSDPDRKRKLLLHRREINKITGMITIKGLTVIPLSIYIKNNRVKIEIALARGRRKYDRREKIKEKELKKEIKSLKW